MKVLVTCSLKYSSLLLSSFPNDYHFPGSFKICSNCMTQKEKQHHSNRAIPQKMNPKHSETPCKIARWSHQSLILLICGACSEARSKCQRRRSNTWTTCKSKTERCASNFESLCCGESMFWRTMCVSLCRQVTSILFVAEKLTEQNDSSETSGQCAVYNAAKRVVYSSVPFLVNIVLTGSIGGRFLCHFG